MARARITENLGEGRYKVEVRQNTAAILARIADIDQQLEQLADRRAELASQLTAATAALTDLDGQLIAVLQNSTLTQAEKDKQTREIVKQQQVQRLAIVRIEAELALNDAQRLSLLTKQTDLRRFETEHIKTVWCADYSPTLGPSETEEVGTLEVLGEEREVLLQPAKDQYRPWTPAVDGELTPVIAQSPLQWLYNTCVVTGWQKYRPTYRFAKVLEIINHDRMKVELIEPHKSLYGDVDVTPLNPDQSAVSYADVACEYLDCNTDAFVVGDEVVVQYTAQSPDAPKVIGFRHDPQPCGALNFYTQAGDRLRINPAGLAWVLSHVTDPKFGNASWAATKTAASWHGYALRHFTHFATPEASAAVLYHKGFAFQAPGVVHGVAVRGKFFLAVCAVAVESVMITSLYSAPIPQPLLEPTPTPCVWTHVLAFPALGFFSGVYGDFQLDPVSSTLIFIPTPFFFNTAATKGVIKYQEGRSGFKLLTITKPGDVFMATLVPIPFPVTPTEGLPDMLYTEFIGLNSDDGLGNEQINTRTSYYFVGGDIRDETPRFLTLVTEFHTTKTHTETGPYLPWKGVAGSGSEPTTETWTDDRHQFARLICEDIGLDLQLYDVTFSANKVNTNSYNTGGAVTPDNPDGLLSWVDTVDASEQSYERTMPEHLNIGGAAPVMVLRDAVGTSMTSFTASGPLAGDDPRETSSSSASHGGTWTWTLVSGAQRVDLGSEVYTEPADEDVSNHAQDVRSMRAYDQDSTIVVKVMRAPHPWTAEDRDGHVITSAPLWNSIAAHPTLPTETGGGNQSQFLTLGIG